MTPVMLLTDGYIANAAEPWKVPDPGELRAVSRASSSRRRTTATRRCCPTSATRKGARPWIKPGTPGLMHRIGGIEKAVDTGHIDYSPGNHQAMTDARRTRSSASTCPTRRSASATATGKLAVVGWGSTYGPIHQAVRRAREQGLDVSHIHVRHIWPLPANLGDLLARLRQGAGARDEHRPVQDRAARPVPGRRASR